MSWLASNCIRSRRRGTLAATLVAVGTFVPGVFIACTPSPAGAQSTDPLGPTIAQVESELEAVCNEIPGNSAVPSPLSAIFTVNTICNSLATSVPTDIG
jgi:hypothetical protein